MARHLTDMKDFVKSFKDFCDLLIQKQIIFKDEENSCRLFDIWLANYKDERVLEEQFKKDPWEDS